MCGFAGFIDYKGAGDVALVEAMANTLLHRGPDDGGFECIRLDAFSIGLGFRRLSIIDLSPSGHQPMHDASGEFVIMLNGEIYNYAEIRAELESRGCTFKSGSDTEVVLQAYIQDGIRALDRFIGMFSIALLDKAHSKFYLIRDRAGVKPLFYYEHPQGVLFASELKAFHKHPAFKKEINKSALNVFFFNGNIPAPYTIFKNASKVEPGQYIEINLRDQTLSKHRYWDVYSAYNERGNMPEYKEALTQTEMLMQSAFKYRMVADVPVGVFLSGGYDSTAVTALLSRSVRKLNTFTIGFEEKSFDESGYAREVAAHLGTNHHEFTCTIREAMDILPDLPWIFDEPFGDSSAIPTTLVSRIARKHVTVALSADAGDELFAGYPRHRKASVYLARLNRIPSLLRNTAALGLEFTKVFHPAIAKPDRLEKLRLLLKSEGILKGFHLINQTFTEKEIKRIVKDDAGFLKLVFDTDPELKDDVEPLNKILAVEYKSYLVDDILQKVDRSTMSASLEGREPFLDHRLVEWVAAMPSDYKLKDGVSKRILKDIVHQYVPREMMDRPKMGFGVPVKDWLKHELRDLFEEVMGEDLLKRQDCLNTAVVLELKQNYLEGRLGDFERLWFVFVFLQWYKKWMT